MNLKNHKPFLAWTAAVAVTLIAVAFLVNRAAARYAGIKNSLSDSQNRLQNLYGRSPFPSEENVAAVAANTAELKTLVEALEKDLQLGQIEPREMEPAQFMSLLGAKIDSISGAIKTPLNFYLGFERYATHGVLPDRANIAMLVYQLETADRLCSMLAQANVAELISFERDIVEITAARRQPQTGPPQPYTKMTFRMTFRGKESSVLEALNKMAANRPFISVSYVKLENETRPMIQVPAPAAQPPVQQDKSDERETRVSAGKEDIGAEIFLDVYRFIGHDPQPGREGKSG